MMLDDAASSFIEQAKQSATASGVIKSYEHALALLREYFPQNITPGDITDERLRDFVARWYVEKRAANATGDLAAAQSDNISFEAAAYQALVAALTHFFNWTDAQSKTQLAAGHIAILTELEQSVPRAIAITVRLTKRLAARGGAFSFPEFLTSFEDGGQSQYDIGACGQVGAIDSNFRIMRIEGTSVEAEDLNTGERIFPIIFPEEVADLLVEHDIINLELIRAKDRWQIASCGFAYPPGTDY